MKITCYVKHHPKREKYKDVLHIPFKLNRDDHIQIIGCGNPNTIYWVGFITGSSEKDIDGYIHLMITPKKLGDHDFTMPCKVDQKLGN